MPGPAVCKSHRCSDNLGRAAIDSKKSRVLNVYELPGLGLFGDKSQIFQLSRALREVGKRSLRWHPFVGRFGKDVTTAKFKAH